MSAIIKTQHGLTRKAQSKRENDGEPRCSDELHAGFGGEGAETCARKGDDAPCPYPTAKTGGILHEFPTRTTKLSQYCHGCRMCVKKPLAQRFHDCACGIGPIQRDLYSAFLAAYLDPPDFLPSSAQYHVYWEGADLRLRAALERLQQRAKEGQILPRSVGITGAGARLPESLVTNRQGLVSRRGSPEELG